MLLTWRCSASCICFGLSGNRSKTLLRAQCHSKVTFPVQNVEDTCEDLLYIVYCIHMIYCNAMIFFQTPWSRVLPEHDIRSSGNAFSCVQGASRARAGCSSTQSQTRPADLLWQHSPRGAPSLVHMRCHSKNSEITFQRHLQQIRWPFRDTWLDSYKASKHADARTW